MTCLSTVRHHLLFTPILSLAFIILSPGSTNAAIANHVVISEVQIAGASATHDFIELYNPTSEVIDLSTYRLIKRTAEGTVDQSIVVFGSGALIQPHSYYLWCNSVLAEELECDRSTSSTIANHNTVALRDGAADTGILIDAVSIGVVNNGLQEGISIDPAPSANQSVERKALSTSTSSSMAPGGSDALLGNGWDTNDNSDDFDFRDTPQPQNSQSPTETPPTTGQPSPTPTSQPVTTPTPAPTIQPTATPTQAPISTPTATPTSQPISTPTPTQQPTPSPKPGIIFGRILVCHRTYREIMTPWRTIYIPRLHCSVQSII